MIEYFTKLIGECPSYLYGVVYVLSFFLVVFGLYVILFARIVSTISTNDLLLYPVLLCMVIAAVTLAIRIVRKFGMKSRRS